MTASTPPETQKSWHFLSQEHLGTLIRDSQLTFTLPYLLESQQDDLFEWVYQAVKTGPHSQKAYKKDYSQLNLFFHCMSWYPAQENLRLWNEKRHSGQWVALEINSADLTGLSEPGSVTAIEQVQYVDFLSEPVIFVEGNVVSRKFNPATMWIKDLSFQHQQETRLILTPESPRTIQTQRLVPVDLKVLDAKLVVSPYAPPEFMDDLRRKILVEGRSIPVRWSNYIAGLYALHPERKGHKPGAFGFMGLPLEEGETFPELPELALQATEEVKQLLEAYFVVDTDDPSEF